MAADLGILGLAETEAGQKPWGGALDVFCSCGCSLVLIHRFGAFGGGSRAQAGCEAVVAPSWRWSRSISRMFVMWWNPHF